MNEFGLIDDWYIVLAQLLGIIIVGCFILVLLGGWWIEGMSPRWWYRHLTNNHTNMLDCFSCYTKNKEKTT